MRVRVRLSTRVVRVGVGSTDIENRLLVREHLCGGGKHADHVLRIHIVEVAARAHRKIAILVLRHPKAEEGVWVHGRGIGLTHHRLAATAAAATLLVLNECVVSWRDRSARETEEHLEDVQGDFVVLPHLIGHHLLRRVLLPMARVTPTMVGW